MDNFALKKRRHLLLLKMRQFKEKNSQKCKNKFKKRRLKEQQLPGGHQIDNLWIGVNYVESKYLSD